MKPMVLVLVTTIFALSRILSISTNGYDMRKLKCSLKSLTVTLDILHKKEGK
jgi:hypothetical protein